MHGLMRSHNSVYVVAIIASILLSVWSVLREGVINPDAICYLQSAESMKEGLSFASRLCDQAHWPFYSALIYAVAKITHLPVLYAAHGIDGFFALLSVVIFIAIIKFFKNTQRIAWLAAATFLLAHELNAIRDTIIRDHGFWAFYLLSLYFLLHFFRHRSWGYALGFSISMVLSALFRIEGLIFLLLIPMAAWFSNQQKLTAFLKLNTLTLLGAFLFGLLLLLNSDTTSLQLGRLGEVKFQLFHGLDLVSQQFNANAKIISDQLLNRYSAHASVLILTLVLIFWYGIQVIANLSLIYALLVVYAWKKRLLAAPTFVLWVYVAVNVMITAAFLVQHMFLSKRYLVALVLVLMIWVPFALDKIIQTKNKKVILVVALLMLISAWGGIVRMGYSKAYIRDAGEWVKDNVPQQASLYSNDYQIMHYSNHFGSEIFAKVKEFKTMTPEQWKNFDYIALRLSRSDQQGLIEEKYGAPLKAFISKRGDRVVIYKIR